MKIEDKEKKMSKSLKKIIDDRKRSKNIQTEFKSLQDILKKDKKKTNKSKKNGHIMKTKKGNNGEEKT